MRLLKHKKANTPRSQKTRAKGDLTLAQSRCKSLFILHFEWSAETNQNIFYSLKELWLFFSCKRFVGCANQVVKKKNFFTETHHLFHPFAVGRRPRQVF